MRIELTIKVDYLPNWGVLEGVRELLQNAKDAETEFSAPMSVRMRGDVLVIENDGCTMPYEALLLGHSTKSERGDLIGKFGEGFKLGILALLRKGHSVKIRNGSEVWEPAIVRSEKFGGVKVLAFDIAKGRKSEERIAIEVGGISPDFFRDTIRPRFLWLDHSPMADKVVTDYGTLLLAPTYMGKVYVKGIFVEHKIGLTVGYDLADCDVDRDRRMVSSYDFQYKTRTIWQYAMAQRPDLFNAFSAIVEANGPEAQNLDSYDATRLPEDFVTHAVDAFVTRHGAKAVPVSNLGESHDLEHFGRLGVVVSAGMRAILESRMGTLAKVQEELKNEVTRTYGWHELSFAQKKNVARAVHLVNAISPVELAEVNVCDFGSSDLEGTFGVNGIQVSARIAESASACLTVLVHEVAHRSGHDGEKGHVCEIERIWSGIVEGMAK